MDQTLCDIPDMERELWALLAQVPAGSVTTCGALAEALGDRTAARWVGHVALHHEHAADCPCHRILRAGGKLGGYVGGGESAKIRRLVREGVDVRGEKVDLSQCEFRQFAGSRPLERLRRVQESVVKQVSLRPRRRLPRTVGGVDVSYVRPGEGVAGYSLVNADTEQLVYSTTVRGPVCFPYIPTYLAFRELPILLDLIAEVRKAGKLAQIVLVDGSGILHQRHVGIASHLGVVADVPTVGVTKKLLFGQVEFGELQAGQSRPIRDDNRVIGTALRPTAGSRRPIFISPGHRTDLAFAERLVRHVLFGHRLPEPIYWADRLSRQAGRKSTRRAV